MNHFIKESVLSSVLYFKVEAYYCFVLMNMFDMGPMVNLSKQPTNAMSGGDNCKRRSPWRVQVKQMTKVCWHLIAPHPPESSWAK